MSKTKRNDMGKEIVRDGKAYRAMNERLDPWNKEYYHAKGMKKIRYKEIRWEFNHAFCCTNGLNVDEYINKKGIECTEADLNTPSASPKGNCSNRLKLSAHGENGLSAG